MQECIIGKKVVRTTMMTKEGTKSMGTTTTTTVMTMVTTTLTTTQLA